MKSHRCRMFGFLIILALIAVYADITFAMSDETEIAIGRGVDTKLREKYGVLENIQVQKYVEHVGLQIVNVCGRQDLVYHFTVLNLERINSLAAPGGYVYVTKGMLANLKNEAELAAVLAHQIVHIARRHGIQQIERQMEYGLPYAVRTAYHFIKSGHPKKLETEADIKGMECLFLAGYDPNAMMEFLNIVQIREKENSGLVDDLVRTHYKTTKRIDALRLMRENLRAADTNKYNSVIGNYYPQKYKEEVLDIIGLEGI